MIQMLPLILGTVVGYYIGCQIGSALFTMRVASLTLQNGK